LGRTEFQREVVVSRTGWAGSAKHIAAAARPELTTGGEVTYPVKYTKQQALAMLEKIGPRELIHEASRTLPDRIDVDRDAALLARYGIEPPN
jgi:hypothetical protein